MLRKNASNAVSKNLQKLDGIWNPELNSPFQTTPEVPKFGKMSYTIFPSPPFFLMKDFECNWRRKVLVFQEELQRGKIR